VRDKSFVTKNKGVFNMSFETLSWALVVLSLAGNVFVIKKNVLGQWLWAFSNIGWVIFDLYIGAYSQAFLFAVYLGLCIWGIIAWTKDQSKSAPEKA
jgi:nicotinamide riboside transporter PnuC